MRNGWWGCAALVVALWAGGAGAADLTLSGSGAVEYDDNAFREDRQGESDLFFRLRPAARLHEDRGQDFRYFLEYAFPFDFATRNSDLGDVDHLVNGRLVYHPNDRLEIFAADSFRYLRGSEFGIAEFDEEGEVRINEERERVTLNLATAGATYAFTPRLDGSLRGSHQHYDSDRDDRAENFRLAGAGSLSYLVTPRHRLGGGVEVVRQEFEETDFILANQATTYQVFASWLWTISERTNLSVRVGPGYVESEQDDSFSTRQIAPIPFQEVVAGTVIEGFVDETGAPILFGSGTEAEFDTVLIPQVDSCFEAEPGITVALPPSGLCSIIRAGSLDRTAVVVKDDQALAQQIQNQAPIVPGESAGGQDDTRLNVFADVALTRSWTPNFHTGLRYVRTQGDASGLGGAVIEDRVSLSNNWDFADRWNLFVRADWSNRESITEATAVAFRTVGVTPAGFSTVELAQLTGGPTGTVTIRGQGTEIETMRYGAAGRVTHRWTRNTSFWGQLAYNRQESQGGTLGDPSDFDNFLASVGVLHVFDPIKLW